eukprot:271963-Prymnesium_polylepis.1
MDPSPAVDSACPPTGRSTGGTRSGTFPGLQRPSTAQIYLTISLISTLSGYVAEARTARHG